MKIKITLLNLFLVLAICCSAQIVTIDPPFATVDDEVTITYDATQGSAGLVGVAPVFMHSGVVTVAGGSGNWQYVQGNWGTYDANGIMEDMGNNVHTKTINIRDYYGIPQGEEVTDLAFVFRNEDGSLEGKTSDGQDIFVPLSDGNSALQMNIVTPVEAVVITTIGQTIPININVSANADIQISENGMLLSESSSPTNTYNYDLEVTSGGQHNILMTATVGAETVSDSFTYIINPPVVTADPPAGTKNGVNQIDANTVRLQLWAPYKNYVYVIGDFNNWQPDVDYFMNRSSDGSTWWIDIEDLDPNEEYAFQYYVNGSIKVADPYSEKILDPWNDQYISEATYPNLKPYPAGQATGAVTAFKTQDDVFDWQNDNYDRPEKSDLVIYELLLRDFVDAHNYQTLLDTLDYLHLLGINAIELMPVNEFEGNQSWGYNPSFHMALDKYYGTPESFKLFIDACHERGIAVILDVVYNHVFSQSPLAQLYWDATNFRPSGENPWLNVTPKHPFNVGSDVNHETQATKDWVDQVMTYWMEEYHVDGFRFDLSKGFTQTANTDVGAWSNYDAGRIALLKRIADVVWNLDPDFYVILEHFAAANEERELSNYGMMIWGNGVHEYNEATMGWSSSLSGVDYQVSWRDLNDPHLVGYLESHDEERLMYKNLEYGNSNSSYDIQEKPTALDRQELAGAFFFTIPGPKMFWQFAELGYHFSINRCEDGTINPDCRLSPKPIRWDYFYNEDRRDVYNTWAALIHLKTNYSVFKTTDYSYNLSSKMKRINLNGNDMNVTVLGNFDIDTDEIDPQFQEQGWWYEYFTGDSINVTNVNMAINLEPGEYRLYIDKKVDRPTVSVKEVEGLNYFTLSPNPSLGHLHLQFELEDVQKIKVGLYDFSGRMIKTIYQGRDRQVSVQSDLDQKVPAGIYFVKLETESGMLAVRKWVVF